MLFGIDLPNLMGASSPLFVGFGRSRALGREPLVLEPSLQGAHRWHGLVGIAPFELKLNEGRAPSGVASFEPECGPVEQGIAADAGASTAVIAGPESGFAFLVEALAERLYGVVAQAEFLGQGAVGLSRAIGLDKASARG